MFDRLSKYNLPLGPQKEASSSDTLDHDAIQTIPSIFYGGADPNIYEEQEKNRSIVHDTITHVPPKKEQKKMSPPLIDDKPAIVVQHAASTIQAPPPKKKHPRVLLIVIIVVCCLIALAAISYYYLSTAGFFSQQNQQGVATNNVVVKPIVTEPIVSSTQDIANTEPVAVIPVDEPLPSSQDSVLFPRISVGVLADLDLDGLTDDEEVLFNTDVGIADQDGDGYLDGLEVINLYHLAEFAPARLIDSPLVREYMHSTAQYRLYYPSAWASSAVDTNGKEVLFSAITGDYVVVHTFEKNTNESFPLWFGRVIEGQLFTDLVSQVNRFSQPFYLRKDGFVAYYEGDKQVYVLVYHPGENDVPLFPHIMTMMVQSFRPSGVGTFLPEQQVIPIEPPAVVEDSLTSSTVEEAKIL
ncbi:MAG: hypothetical protein GW939_03795 [Candidatus Magasanikbacteria bacterium]|uniref:EF-hand domain-containing protein n=1 Tax=Candidatus Magasanikbacteria bacterium CG10_big_fil_rev_8_21_14_0_10_38_6 TaxID=1974647 RepID=A0A2M6P269_9BACT|nr:hypothetical protein [Candidatus Magasanikbacteria bacterium]NCS99739.1 hypothetical protein [Candidatus Parcubacteria bacterium]PIR77784.1 MAG: hypothetical protein COU30_00560 [Candidatus Magasanikbacteria bacterium CG10_big_fil_rev_8_21_14_0_10_38_6]